MTKRTKILFLTSEEAGQANVQLATIHSLLQHRSDDVEVHLASFDRLAKRCPAEVTFHTVPGIGHARHFLLDGKLVQGWDTIERRILHAPGFLGVLDLFWRNFPFPTVTPWPPSEYISHARHIEGVLEDVNPDLVVLDAFFTQATDAVRKSGREYVYLIPNSFKDVALPAQELGAFTWPCIGTGFPYPLPWYLYPFNIICLLFLPIYALISPAMRRFDAIRHAAGYPGQHPILNQAGTKICMGPPALDYPGVHPPDVVSTGPILLPSEPFSGALADWLERGRGRTIMIALGSHWLLPYKMAKPILDAIEVVLTGDKDVQVLWKLKRADGFQFPELEQAMQRWGERLRVIQWLDVDPISVLRGGQVGIVIHHGGSNSYHEALTSGVPQIALPSWIDCYDFASRMEWLGIGRWGNRSSAPFFNSPDLSRCILDILASYSEYKHRAERCAGIARRTGLAVRGPQGEDIDWSAYQNDKGEIEGRDVSAEWIYRKAIQLEQA